MPYQILISTPHAAFGELLRISLEETGDYRVRLVQTAAEALASLGRLAFDLVVLDADLADQPLAETAARVLALRGPRLMVIPPDNNTKHPMLAGIEIHGFIYRPFYTPDLLESVGDLMRPTQISTAAQSAEANSEPPTWLENPSLAEDHLQKSLVGCTAHLVLVVRGSEILVSLGSLDRPAAQEIANILLRSASGGLKNDLARYFRLSNIPVDYILYARSLTGEARLALVYEVSTPLSRIRSQMNAVVKALAQAPAAASSAQAAAPSADAFEWMVDAESGSESGLSEGDLANLTSWLSEMPSPDPNQAAESAGETGDETPQMPSPSELGWISPDAPEETPPGSPDTPQAELQSAPVSVETLPESRTSIPAVWTVAEPVVVEPPLVGEVVQPTPPLEVPPAPEIDSAVDTAAQMDSIPDLQSAAEGELLAEDTVQLNVAPEPEAWVGPVADDSAIEVVDPTAETRPLALRHSAPLSLLDTASPAFSSLSYAACLIPRMPYHYLNGEIAEKLSAWLPELCLAFGWRLTGIHIRPDTCQWLVQLSALVPPAQMIRAVRQITSQRLFDHFNWLALENPSGDFWAPGYLIISGMQLPAPHLVRQYIIQTRRQQGLQND